MIVSHWLIQSLFCDYSYIFVVTGLLRSVTGSYGPCFQVIAGLYVGCAALGLMMYVNKASHKNVSCSLPCGTTGFDVNV